MRLLTGLSLCLVLWACSALPQENAGANKDNLGEFLTVSERLDRIEMDMALVMQDLALLHGRDPSDSKGPQMPGSQSPRKELRVSAPKAPEDLVAKDRVEDPTITGSIPQAKASASGWQGAIQRQPNSVRLVSDSPELAGKIALHLASYKTLKSLTAGRDVTVADLGRTIASLELYAEPVMISGELFYRLKAGPMASAAEAERICRQIQSQGSYCKVAQFTDS